MNEFEEFEKLHNKISRIDDVIDSSLIALSVLVITTAILFALKFEGVI